ncbi:MAG: hypothetical protein Q7T71_06150 [Herbiconiux sp.]|nr:hypothetical protein [Herbiconiux sp.]
MDDEDVAEALGTLEGEERAAARRLLAEEARLETASTRKPRWATRLPRAEGSEARYRSPLVWVSLVVVAFAGFGAWVQGDLRALGAGLVIAALMLLRTRGSARRLRPAPRRGLVAAGGPFGVEVELSGMQWGRFYVTPGTITGSGFIVLTARAGVHPFTRLTSFLVPGVSRRRVVIFLSSSWRLPATHQRLSDGAVSSAVRAALRANGLEITDSEFRGWVARPARVASEAGAR